MCYFSWGTPFGFSDSACKGTTFSQNTLHWQPPILSPLRFFNTNVWIVKTTQAHPSGMTCAACSFAVSDESGCFATTTLFLLVCCLVGSTSLFVVCHNCSISSIARPVYLAIKSAAIPSVFILKRPRKRALFCRLGGLGRGRWQFGPGSAVLRYGVGGSLGSPN